MDEMGEGADSSIIVTLEVTHELAFQSDCHCGGFQKIELVFLTSSIQINKFTVLVHLLYSQLRQQKTSILSP